jgi:capsular exopolysaccharide synthesis family protein
MSEMNEEARLPARYENSRPPAALPFSQALATFEQFQPSGSSLQDYVNVLLRRKWLALVSLVVVSGTVCVVTATMPRIYEATATLLVSGEGETRSARSDTVIPPAMAAMVAPNLETHVELIQGESTAKETAAWLNDHGGPCLSAGAIRQSIRAKAVPNTELVRVSADARSPQQAQIIANAAAQAYIAMNRRRARGSSESASRYLSEQLALARKNLAGAENALRAFKESTGTVATDAAAGDVLSRATSLSADLGKTRADLAQVQERLAKVRAQVAEQNRSITAGQVRDNAVVQQLRVRLADLEGQRIAARSRYTNAFSSPLDQIDEQIRNTTAQLNAEIRNIVRGGSGDLAVQQALTGQLVQGEAEVAALRARCRQLQGELRLSERELQRIPARQITLARLQREVEVAQTIHSDLLARSQEIEVGRVMALGNTALAERASIPRLPVKPNVPFNLSLGLLLGLGVGVGLAFFREQLDDTLRDQEDVERLAEAPVLGTVPLFERREEALVLPARSPHSRAVEAYRALRYSLGFVTPGAGGHTVLVTSAGPLEGKTTTSLNLAIAAALSGRRVVLADADLRRPSLHRVLGLNGAKGISDVLAGEATLPEALQEFRDTGLRFISSGTRVLNPTDLLDSARMRDLVQQLKEQADLVIFDSPPLLSVADSLVLASLSDAVLMVCVPGHSHRRAIQRGRLLLAHVGHTISGLVLNKVEYRAGYGYYGYYYYYHYPSDHGRRRKRRSSETEKSGEH